MAILLPMLFFVSTSVKAQLVVTDPLAVTTAIENALQAYDQAVQQYQKLTGMYTQLQNLESSLNGTTNFATILDNELFLDNLPATLEDAILASKSSPEYFQLKSKCPRTSNAARAQACDLAAQMVVIEHGYQRRRKIRELRIKRLEETARTAVNKKERDTALIEINKERTQINNDEYSIQGNIRELSRMLGLNQKAAIDEDLCKGSNNRLQGCH